jgi:asparagine synthase (glutamine-hydrolysing)
MDGAIGAADRVLGEAAARRRRARRDVPERRSRLEHHRRHGRAAPDRRAGEDLRVGFAEPTYDERPYAAAVARHVGAEHADLLFTADDIARSLDDVGSLLDEPLVDSSFLPIYALSRFAREAVVVALSGDGGDELFCGYPTFLADRGAAWIRHLPKWARRIARAAVNRLPVPSTYGSVESLLKQFVRAMDEPAAIRTQLLLGGLRSSEQHGLLSGDARAALAELDPYDELLTTPKANSHETEIDRRIAQHCRFYLAEQNLVTVDRASMACGLEVRAPFLDHPLVELASRIPSSLKLRGWTTKYILRRTYRSVLPPAILTRRKQGFGVPIGPWLRGPLRPALEERLSPRRINATGVFEPSAVRCLIDEHVSGGKNHRKILWTLLMFDAWCERYLGNRRSTVVAP